MGEGKAETIVVVGAPEAASVHAVRLPPLDAASGEQSTARGAIGVSH